MSPTPEFRILNESEVEMLVDWAALEGWNPGFADAAAFHATDPGGFLGAFVDGAMAAGIAAVAYDAAYGFIGLYICRPDMRRRGLGKAVWDEGMAYLGNRTIGLDGVPERQGNYRSMGFLPEYRTFRYSGRPALKRASHDTVLPVTADQFEAIATFDRAFFPAARRSFLRRWLAAPHVARVCMSGGTMLGYGVARACRTGFKIGPLFARELATAEALLTALAEACGGDIHIDVPESRRDFIAFLAQAGLSPGFETARMYRGPAPPIDMDGVFGVTTLELG